MNLTLYRRFRFSAIHSLKSEVDGCGTPLIHGHDYTLDVGLQSLSESWDIWLIDRDKFNEMVLPVLRNKYHNRNLNNYFETATAEHLVKEIYEDLSKIFPTYRIKEVRLAETKKNIFKVSWSGTG